MSDITQVAFQIDNDSLAEIDRLVSEGARSRAEVLRTAVREFLARRREERIDAQLAAGYGSLAPGPVEEQWADLSLEGLEAGSLDW